MFNLIISAFEEITTAASGGDWGYGALAELLGNEGLAQSIVNIFG